MRLHILAAPVALAIIALAAGCAPRTHRAHLHQLQYRAVFDLACDASQLGLYHVDARTKVVVGCGRRLVYQEDCVPTDASFTCTWRLDTPVADQWTWPRRPSETKVATSTEPADCPGGRAIQTELFDAGNPPSPREPQEIIRDAPYRDPLPVPAARPPGRTIFDELDTR